MANATMTAQEQLEAYVQQEWSESATVAGWRKWFPKMLVQFQAGTDLLVDTASIDRGMQVLDIASGSGNTSTTLPRHSAR